MNQIQKQVSIARRLMTARLIVSCLTWTLTLGGLLAVAGVAIPKVWAIDALDTSTEAGQAAAARWNLAWIVGSFGAAAIIGIAWAWLRRSQTLDAAVEIDRRFQLKERLSSVLSLDPNSLDSEAGKALVKDAEYEAGRIVVKDHFTLGFNWRNLTPIAPAIGAFLVVILFNNQIPIQAESENSLTEEQRERIESANDQLRERIQEEIRIAEEQGLEEAEAALREIDEITREAELNQPRSKEEALIRLNEAREALEERARQLGSPEAMRKQLAGMDEAGDGPAEEASEAMRDGDFDQAAEELEELAEKLANGELSEQEQSALAQQLQQMQEQLEQAAEEHEQAKQALQEQLEQAMAEGDLQKAGDLQKQLDDLSAMDRQMQQANDLAKSLGDAADALKKAMEGGQTPQEAAQALEEAMAQCQQCEADAQSMAAMRALMERIAECKGQINGADLSALDSFADGNGGKKRDNPGGKMGKGNGEGERPEEATETNAQDERVAADAQQGEAVVSATVGGENVAGASRAEVIRAVGRTDEVLNDPTEIQSLPRRQQEHTKEYLKQYSGQDN